MREWKDLLVPEDFSKQEVNVDVFSVGASHRPILLMHELPGMTPETLELAFELKESYRVYLPLFFGRVGGNRSLLPMAQTVTRRWNFFSHDDLGTIRQEMKQLVRAISDQHGGEKVVVIGNCMSGAIPLELIAEDCVDLAILCQPASPFFGDGQHFSLDQPAIDRTRAALAAHPEKQIVAFNYLNDGFAPIKRLETMMKGLCQESSQCTLHVAREPCAEAAAVDFGLATVDWILVPDDGAHSTITAASNRSSDACGSRPSLSDRRIFRDTLMSYLEP